jgi:hypothetical protein
MVAIGSLLLVIAMSLLIVRIGTIALTMTGLSEEVARFQSLSAFSGAGYTTSEAETIVSGPARRRVVAMLMRAGSVGAVSGIATAILSFVGAEQATISRLIVLAAGIAGLIFLARSRRLNRWATPVIRRLLQRFTELDLRDYAGLLHLHGDWRVSVIDVEPDSWLSGRDLADLDLPSEGVTVLGVERKDGSFVGVPGGETHLHAGSQLILYGHSERLRELQERPEGAEDAHRDAQRDHKKEKEREQREEKKRATDD